MATVIDELIVRLGLDPKDFTAGRKKVAQDLLQTKEEARKAAKDIEKSGKEAAQFFSQLRGQVILLLATLTGGKSLKQFTSDLVDTSAAAGRAAVIIGANVRALSEWQGMSIAMGGSASGVTSSIAGLNQQLQTLSLTGESSVLPYLRALNIGLEGAGGHIKTVTELLPELHKAFQGMDAARAAAIGHGLGLSDELINILIQSDEQFNKFMQDQQRWGVITKEQAKAAAELQYSSAGVQRSFETLGRMIMERLGPAFVRFNEWLTKILVWFQNNPKILEGAILGLSVAITALTVAMASSTLTAFAGGLRAIMGLVGLGGLAGGGMIGVLLALAAAIALVFDDWKTWTEGGEAYFGHFFDAIAHGSHALVALWNGDNKEMKDQWKNVLDDMENIYGDYLKHLEARRNKIKEEGKKGGVAGAANETVNPTGSPMRRFLDWAVGMTKREPGGSGGGAASGPAPAISPAKRDENEKSIQRFMSYGWTREQAAGIVANQVGESQGDVHAQGDYNQSTGVYDAYGKSQWHADRQAKFRELFGHDIRQSTSEEQDKFTDWELRNTHKAAGDALRKQTTAEGATDVVTRKFEIPADPDGQSSLRSSIARTLMKAPPPTTNEALPGASASAQNSTANDNRSSSTSTTNVKQITVNTNATDAQGIAKDIKPALERDSFAAQGNYSYQ